MCTVVTQVFPDEYHLHTLDQFLSATARLNPHVNIKAIVIGMMDRLAAYATREAGEQSPEQREQAEEEATTKLLERLRVSKESKSEDTTPPQSNGDQEQDGTPTEQEAEVQKDNKKDAEHVEDAAESEVDSKARGIPENARLFEIFNEQVMNLVSMQRLPIQDITALLHSLLNLAL